MLAARLFVRPLAIGSLAVAVVLAAAWGCQGPDTFLRKDDAGTINGAGGKRTGGASGQLGGAPGSGGFPGSGGSGLGGSGAGGSGVGGMLGTGGRGGAGGGLGGITGTGGRADGGTDAPGTGGMVGTGGTTGRDAGVDGDGSVVSGTGPCAGLCAPSTPVTAFSFATGTSYHSTLPVALTEACFETTTVVHGANCSNFTGRTLTVNGAPEPGCGSNFTPPPPVNGGYCFQFSAGMPDFAQIAVF